MSDNKKALVGSILFIGFIGTLFYFFDKEKSSLRENGQTTVVTLQNTSGDRMDCNYSVNGKPYVAIKNVRDQYLQNGEQYLLLYNPKDPSSHWEIDYTSPIIVEEDYLKTETVGIDQPIKLNKEIRFVYLVNGENYTRFQEPPENVKVDYDKSYAVKYNKEKPSIGYIIFE
jgi:hypothetical protein